MASQARHTVILISTKARFSSVIQTTAEIILHTNRYFYIKPLRDIVLHIIINYGHFARFLKVSFFSLSLELCLTVSDVKIMTVETEECYSYVNSAFVAENTRIYSSRRKKISLIANNF